MDNVETKEAEIIYYNYSKKYIWFYMVPLICTILSFLPLIINLLSSTHVEYVFIALICVFLILFIAGIFVYTYLMIPFRKLRKIAMRNDLIRHDERIREEERQRIKKNKK